MALAGCRRSPSAVSRDYRPSGDLYEPARYAQLPMFDQAVAAYEKVEAVRPLVRPTYNQFEVALLPPYGKPEVDQVAEFGTYVIAGLCLGAVAEWLDDG